MTFPTLDSLNGWGQRVKDMKVPKCHLNTFTHGILYAWTIFLYRFQSYPLIQTYLRYHLFHETYFYPFKIHHEIYSKQATLPPGAPQQMGLALLDGLPQVDQVLHSLIYLSHIFIIYDMILIILCYSIFIVNYKFVPL